MTYSIYKIQYKNFIYYGCTNDFNRRTLEQIKQIFDVIFYIRTKGREKLKSKSLYEIGYSMYNDHKCLGFMTMNDIRKRVSILEIAKVYGKKNAATLEALLIETTDNINKSNTKYH